MPTVHEIHTQRLVPQAPTVVTQAHPTTQIASVKVGDAVVGHQHVGDAVVGKTADVSGFAFSSETRHDAPVQVAVAAPVPVPVVAAPVLAQPIAVHAPIPVAHVHHHHVLAAPAVVGAPGKFEAS